MGKLLRRQCVLIVFLVASVVCCELLALMMAAAILLRATQSGLVRYAESLRDNDVASSREARKVLEHLERSGNAECSDASLGAYRDDLYQAEYLKDAGIVRGGKIVCSAEMGRLEKPLLMPEPEYRQHDGINVYRNLSPPQMGGLMAIGLSRGNAYVVFSPYNFNPISLYGMHFVTNEYDPESSQVGELLGDSAPLSGAQLYQDAQGRGGGSYYATRCTVEYTDCVTTYLSWWEIVQLHERELAGFLFFGAFSGILVGLLGNNLYTRFETLEWQLRRAVSRDELRVVYQPIVELATGRIVGAEILARWTNRVGEVVPPDVFIRVAEENGFIEAITRQVAGRALSECAELLRLADGFALNLNVSAVDLASANFAAMLEELLEEHGVEAGCLNLEITESISAGHRAVFETLAELRACGHRILIDDFGTGYSNLSYLHEIEIDAIKIDKVFTRAVSSATNAGPVLPHILALAEEIKCGVIIEGIETEEQAEYFIQKKEGILGQGWLYGRPVGVDEFVGLMGR